MNTRTLRHMAAVVGLTAMALLGAASLALTHPGGPDFASSNHPTAPQPSYVKPVVPAMQSGSTAGELPTTTTTGKAPS